MKESMTSHERMIAAMKNQETDRIPCGPFGIAQLKIDDALTQELIKKTDIFLQVSVEGVDFLEPMEAPPWGDVHLGKAKTIIGDRYCMVGNLDDMEIVDKLETNAVKALAVQRMEEAGRRGFILSGTASGTYTEKGARNFIAMAETAGRYIDKTLTA